MAMNANGTVHGEPAVAISASNKTRVQQLDDKARVLLLALVLKSEARRGMHLASECPGCTPTPNV